MTTTIYVLGLKEGKFYVGKSDVPESRIISHTTNNGSAWTRKYAPEKVIKMVKGNSFDEDKTTKEYMHHHGIENVRGGSYCQIVLTTEQINNLKKEFQTADDKCFQCSESGHFVSQCLKKVVNEEKSTKRKYETLDKVPSRAPNTQIACQKCGRVTHQTEECCATRNVEGSLINQKKQKTQSSKKLSNSAKTVKTIKTNSKKSTCQRCGRDSHQEQKCYATKDVNGIEIESSSESDSSSSSDSSTSSESDSSSSSDSSTSSESDSSSSSITTSACFRCGRKGHFSTRCFAKTHISGKCLS